MEAEDLRIDTHEAAVCEQAWQLLADAYAHFGPVPTLLERDLRDWAGEALPGWLSSRERFEARQRAPEQNRVAGTSPSLPPGGYAGTYGGPMYGDATVTEENGGLVLRLLPNPDLVADLEHLHYDTFVVRWRTDLAWFGKGTAHFELDPSGQIEELKLDIPNDDLWFHELELVRIR